jgi:hypothetical protein
MFNLFQNIQLSVLFIISIIAITMIGILVVQLIKSKPKKQIVFLLFVYLLILLKIIIDIYSLYLANPTILLDNLVKITLEVCMVTFLWVNRFQLNKIILCLNIIFLIIVVSINFYLPFSQSNVLFFLNAVFYMIYNLLFYFLALNFLIHYCKNV